MPDKCQKKLRTYLFGYPIRHSLAPLLHTVIFESLNVPWTYDLVESTEKNDFLPMLHADDCAGASVTMPHKVAWLTECDQVTEEARAIGAINTVYIRQDPVSGQTHYIGTNTDCIGVQEAFVQNYPHILAESTGRPALVVGGGGACRSAIYAAYKSLGASEIYLVNRDAKEIEGIRDWYAATNDPPTLVHVSTVDMARQLEPPVVVVGTVPDFQPSTTGEILARDITMEFLKKDRKGYVLEMCYHPTISTRFYDLAQSSGWKVLPGTEAMIYQGLAQEVLWMERPMEDMPVEAAKAAIAQALAERQKDLHIT
ncbi:uncharacterized protein E0L32_012417 [Thyridium curvatum]|uniref:Shikimate dehydrogenase substrate binding N-terminal domain-containing protein n=1 Tax=Thyridium curvatum TaxID=1093900 RepID=A0A507BBI0_9PEZI|nr:uncharacterized protein E0L32_012417 [Thyridium curvatum]TPX16596.1 hypothetical protein E0L32_012417 [Thyridium curvatum]